MKNIILILTLILTAVSCNNTTKADTNLEENRAKSYDENDGFITIKGDFIYDEKTDAAIIQISDNAIYAVAVDDKMHQLNKQANTFKKDKFDMIPVTVRVKKIKNDLPNSFWEYKLEIQDILNVEAPKADDDNTIKLGK